MKGVPAKSRALYEIFTMSASFGAKYAPVQGSGRTVDFRFQPGHGGACVRVRVDEETGRVVPLNYTAIQDVGTAINPATVEGQLEGGAVQAVGWGLFERILWDEQGTPTTGSLMDYAIPKASQSPALGTVLVQFPLRRARTAPKALASPPSSRAPRPGQRRLPGGRRSRPVIANDLSTRSWAPLASRNGSPNGQGSGTMAVGWQLTGVRLRSHA